MRSVVVLGFLAAVAAADVGEQLAQAQKKGDIAGIQRLLREARALRTPAQLHGLMKQLDSKRGGAFISAPCLARQLLLSATADGDTRFVADASKVIRARANRPKTGKCAQAMRHYADGLEAVTAKDDDKAAVSLNKALTIMRDEGWTPLAMHAAVELAAVSLRRRDTAAAAKAVGSLAGLFPADADTSLTYILRTLYQNRLKDAPPEVSQAYKKVMAPHTGPRTVSSAGGAPGRGGGARVSKVGAALPRYSKTKPLITVKRTQKGFKIREGFDRAFSATRPFKPGTKYHADGGVTLGFWNYAVGLHMVDPEGRRGQSGESSAGPDPVLAYYFLARKETWGVTKSGVVTIK